MKLPSISLVIATSALHGSNAFVPAASVRTSRSACADLMMGFGYQDSLSTSQNDENDAAKQETRRRLEALQHQLESRKTEYQRAISTLKDDMKYVARVLYAILHLHII